MTDDTPTTSPEGRGRMKLAAILGAAALAIPGGALISNAFAADSGGTGGGTAPSFQPVQETTPEQAPDRDRDGDGRDCPWKDGDGGGSGSGSGSSDQSSGAAYGTQAL